MPMPALVFWMPMPTYGRFYIENPPVWKMAAFKRAILTV
jgi:hypothetical protein